MASGTDQLVGYALILLSGVIFSYYTIWVVILPFVDDGHVLKSFFLPPVYALLIPVVAGVMALMGLGSFIYIVSAKNKKLVQKKTD